MLRISVLVLLKVQNCKDMLHSFLYVIILHMLKSSNKLQMFFNSSKVSEYVKLRAIHKLFQVSLYADIINVPSKYPYISSCPLIIKS